jgi:SAM-dependent methyltransferase
VSAKSNLSRSARYTVRDVGTRMGLFDYRPLNWSRTQWEDSFAAGRTDSYAGLDEVARYGVILGYLSWLGGNPSVLDVGCGAGLLRKRMESVPFRSYVGVDPTPSAIAQADELADSRTRFVLGDPMTADVGTFDVVVCSEVLYVAEDPERLVDRVGSLVREGGHLCTSVWRHPGDFRLWDWIDSRYEKLDAVTVRNPRNRFASRGWRVACHRVGG